MALVRVVPLLAVALVASCVARPPACVLHAKARFDRNGGLVNLGAMPFGAIYLQNDDSFDWKDAEITVYGVFADTDGVKGVAGSFVARETIQRGLGLVTLDRVRKSDGSGWVNMFMRPQAVEIVVTHEGRTCSSGRVTVDEGLPQDQYR